MPILPEALRSLALSHVGRLSAEAMFELPVDFLQFRLEADGAHSDERFNALDNLPEFRFLTGCKLPKGELDAGIHDLLPCNGAEAFAIFHRHARSPD